MKRIVMILVLLAFVLGSGFVVGVTPAMTPAPGGSVPYRMQTPTLALPLKWGGEQVLPPQIPAVVYGETNAPGVVNVYQAESGAFLASGKIWDYNGQLVYVVKIPMDSVPCGTVASFYINQTWAANAQICSGMSLHLDLILEVKSG